MDKKLTPNKSLDQIKEILETMDIKIDNTSLIQDNKIIFKFDDKLYRCRMPSQRERTEAEDQKNKCQIKLMSEGGYKSRKQLKKELKANNTIDIDELEAEKLKLTEELKQIWLDLALLHDNDTDTIEKMKAKAIDIENKHYDICLEIAHYYSPSLDDRTEKEYIEYLTSTCTERLKPESKEVWEAVWSNFNNFQEDTTNLPNKAVMILTHLLLNTRV